MHNPKWFVLVSKTMRYDWENDRFVPSEERIYKFASYQAAKRCYDRKDPDVLKTAKVQCVEVALGAGNPDDEELWESDGFIVQPGCMMKRTE